MAYRTAGEYRVRPVSRAAWLQQAKLHPVAQYQVDSGNHAQWFEQAAEDRHATGRRHKHLKFDRGAIEDLALHDKPGAGKLPSPE